MQSGSGPVNAANPQSRQEAHKAGINVPMLVLGMISVMIVLSGVAFSIYSIIYKTSFQVLNADIPGYIFGAVAVFLGVRYIKAVIAFYKSIKNTGSVFSWRNFVKTVN